MSLESFVNDVVRLELVTPTSGRADTAGPSCSNTVVLERWERWPPPLGLVFFGLGESR